MGFDLHGLAPNTQDNEPEKPDPDKMEWDEKDRTMFDERMEWEEKSGIYFRNNVWSWHPLWDLIINTCADILTPDDAKSGHYNDQHEINSAKSLRIGARLRNHLDSGFIDKYIADRNKELEDAPDEDCYICEGTGGRADPPIVGKGELKCNGCSGTGKKRPAETGYYLDKRNVEDFAVFSINSGGFSIC